VESWRAFVPQVAMPQATATVDGSTGSEERARILRLIDFLGDYDARRNPPVYDIRKYDLFVQRDNDLPAVPGVRLSPAASTWLTVDFIDLPPRPEIPAELVAILGRSEEISPHARPSLLADPVDDPDPELLSAAESWIDTVWEPFAARWAEVNAAKALHRSLFQQRELLATDRESVELVWGFGRLRWAHDDEVVDHPLVTIPVEVEQDESTQQIRVCPSGAPEVEARCLAGLTLADRAGYMSVRQSVNDDDVDFWDPEVLQGLMQPLIRAIDDRGTLVERVAAPSESAVADGSWVLYMRRRLPDYQGFLDRMRELYRDEAVHVPDTLQAVVSDAPSQLANGPSADGRDQVHEPLLLPLPTNEEQERILSQAQHSTGVTVQGPPGTGKSHTIANIISHYVAYGKRVLVVAEKEQALRALTWKIPEGIKDLTVSVLGADADSRRELESSIGQIQTRVTGIDKAFADVRIRQLSDELDAVNRTIAVTTQALLRTREKEVEQLPGRWPAGDSPTRAEAAMWVSANAARLGYVDDELRWETASPLSGGELSEFTALIHQVGVAKADACAAELPPLSGVPTAEDLRTRFAALAALQDSVRSIDDMIQDWSQAVARGDEGLRNLSGRCGAEMEWLSATTGTWLGAIRDQADDPLLADDWASFCTRLAKAREEAYGLRRTLTAHDVVVPDILEPAVIDGLRDARDRLAQSGKLGMFAGPAKRAVQEFTVDGRQPSTTSDIDLCLQEAELRELRRRVMVSWHNQMGRVGGPDLTRSAPEDVLGQALGDLGRALSWPTSWSRLRADLGDAGITAPVAADAQTLSRLSDVCMRASDRITLQELTGQTQGLHDWLRTGATMPRSSALWDLLADSLSGRDLDRWHRLRQDLTELHEIGPAAGRLCDLRDLLASCAPIWTSRILTEPSAAGSPADLEAAWQWRQQECWIGSALTGLTPAELQARLEDLSKQRRRVVAELVAERAWRRLADNLGDRQRQALNSYVRAVTRFGKTGGKFARRWIAEIRTALDESKDAVPVWIMPTQRALTSFRPEVTPPFDVLIIDEASQIGLEALPLFALARRTIVVGDDKQTSPEHVGLDRQLVFDLLDDHLPMVPKYRTLFDPDNSLYDIAFQKFPGVVMLTEHFRCLPQIIGFSNAYAYNNRIIPLRDQLPRPGWSPLGALKVLDGYRNGMVNEPEAEAVVDLVAELCGNPEYDGMDMGVISLLGSTHSKLIWTKLYDRLGPEEMRRRRLTCGEPANFQGDERDVMIISTVVAVNPAITSGRIAAMTGNAAMRRINVAASRARQQMWVVYSADPDQFPNDDLRGQLIRHCREAGVGLAASADLFEKCESQFERDVVQRIIARGFSNVSVQHNVGRFRIDIVIEGASSRLAVECDGDRWHGPDVWHQDRARQQVLERASWTFVRIRGSAFYRDPDAAMLPLWERLEELAIGPGDSFAEVPQPLIREVSALGELASPQHAADTPDVLAADAWVDGAECEAPSRADVDASNPEDALTGRPSSHGCDETHTGRVNGARWLSSDQAWSTE
jgi:very-short-patch-repair endonuclease